MKRSRHDSTGIYSESDQEKDDTLTEEEEGSTTDSMERKRRRGEVEKMRRNRINSCLAELKYLVPAAISEERSGSKLEKAEVLELTVDHLRSLVQKGVFVGMNLATEYTRLEFSYNQDGKPNICETRETRNPHDTSAMAGFCECAHQVSALLASMAALQPELKWIERKFSAHIQQSFKHKFLDSYNHPVQGIVLDQNQVDYRTSNKWETVNDVKIVPNSMPIVLKSPKIESLVTDQKSKGFRPYKGSSSQGRVIMNDADVTHGKPTHTVTCEYSDIVERLPKHPRVCSSTSYKEATIKAPAVNHSVMHEVIQHQSANCSPRFYEARDMAPDYIRCSAAKLNSCSPDSWPNLHQLTMRKYLAPHQSPPKVEPAWFILPSFHSPHQSSGFQASSPTGCLDSLRLPLSLPSMSSFSSYCRCEEISKL